MTSTVFDTVRACAIVLLSGVVLHAENVTAGNGLVVDWREVKSGATILQGADAFDVAHMFVTLVGCETAYTAATRHGDIEDAPPPPKVTPRVHVWAPDHTAYGGRARSFDVGPFTVTVRAIEDDEAQAAFTAALAAAASSIEVSS